MAYWDRAEKEYRACLEALDEFYDGIQNKRNTRVLRTMEQYYSIKKGETIASRPFLCMGLRLLHTVHMKYERYRDQEDKIRERGIFTLTLSNNIHFVRGRYNNDEEFNNEKQKVKDIYKSNLGYYLWSRSKPKPQSIRFNS